MNVIISEVQVLSLLAPTEGELMKFYQVPVLMLGGIARNFFEPHGNFPESDVIKVGDLGNVRISDGVQGSEETCNMSKF